MWKWLQKLVEEEEEPRRSRHRSRDDDGASDDERSAREGADIYASSKHAQAEQPRQPAPMVEALRELWDINSQKVREEPPPRVDTDIYHVEPRNKPIPHRSSPRRERRWRGS